MKEKVVLAYSGGLDTTFCIVRLQEHFELDVIAVTFDLGQYDDFDKVKQRAMDLGAVEHILVDAKEEFAGEFLAKAIKTNCLYEKAYPLHSSLQGYLISRTICRIAEERGITRMAHGNSGLGNDQFRYDIPIKIHAPDMEIIAPVRDGNFTRYQEWKYLKDRNIESPRPDDMLYSIADNMWGFFRGDYSDAGNPEVEANEELLSIVRRENVKTGVEKIWIGFEKGVPCRINTEQIEFHEILKLLNEKLAAYGYGVFDYVESSVYGAKIRQTMEGPAALALIKAHQDLERLTLSTRQLSVKPYLEQRWTELVFQGLYNDPACRDIEAYVDSTQNRCTGEVLLEVRPYSVECVARRSKYSLYCHHLYDYDNAELEHARGKAFAELWGRGTAIANRVKLDN